MSCPFPDISVHQSAAFLKNLCLLLLLKLLLYNALCCLAQVMDMVLHKPKKDDDENN